MNIDAKELIEVLRQQRNNALDEAAALKAALATLEKESNTAKKEDPQAPNGR